MPDSNWTHDTAYTVAEQTNGDGTENNRGRAQWHVVEQILGSKNLDTSGSIGSRSSRDGTYGMFLQTPGSRIDELDELDPEGERACVASGSPSSLDLVATGKNKGPSIADEVGDEDDKGSLDGDVGRFELLIDGSVQPWTETMEDPGLLTI